MNRFTCLSIVVLLIVLISHPLYAASSIEISVTVPYGTGDTLKTNAVSEIQLAIANDVEVTALTMGYVFTAPTPVTWIWQNVGGLGSVTGSIEVIPGSRLDPPNTVFDLGGFSINERDMDGASPDSIQFTGASISGGLQAGPLEHMISLHIKFELPPPGDPGVFCIDTSFMPPAGSFIFVENPGGSVKPDIFWDGGSACWPVIEGFFTFVGGDANNDGSVGVGDVVYIVNYVFKGGPAPPILEAGDANCDGNINVGDAVFLINFIFNGGPPPPCGL